MAPLAVPVPRTPRPASALAFASASALAFALAPLSCSRAPTATHDEASTPSASATASTSRPRANGRATFDITGDADAAGAHNTHTHDAPAAVWLSATYGLVADADFGGGCGLGLMLGGELRQATYRIVSPADFAGSVGTAYLHFDDAPECSTRSKTDNRSWTATAGEVRVTLEGGVATAVFDGVTLTPRTYPPGANGARGTSVVSGRFVVSGLNAATAR